MDVFELRNHVVTDYSDYVRSFITIRDARIRELVEREMNDGALWPDPLIQLNPSFEPGPPMAQLADEGLLHRDALSIFTQRDAAGHPTRPFSLHHHQVDAIRSAAAGRNYVLTTGTGSGKSLAYIVPIVDHVLRRGTGRGIQAIVVYPMNALANSQLGELEKFLGHASPPPVTFRRYTGQESDEDRKEIQANPPDILLTNYVMLELILTRPKDSRLIRSAQNLRFLVFDELHTYRGRQGADVAMLMRRVRDACGDPDVIHVGTSATLSSGGTWAEQRAEVARVASELFGAPVAPEDIIGETLRRATPERSDAELASELTARVRAATPPPTDASALVGDPLASWIESRLGVTREPASGRLIRSAPRPIQGPGGLAADLASLTGLALETCLDALQATLLAGYRATDEHGRPVFAFRLHQFISKGESVYASPEYEADRHITLQAQQYVPGCDRTRVLLPVAFCRECGQDYYVVRRNMAPGAPVTYTAREISDRQSGDHDEIGFLHIAREPWPDDPALVAAQVPESWTEERNGRTVIKRSQRERVPRPLYLSPAAVEGHGDLRAHWLPAPFRFCLHCGVAYSAHQQSDYGKLGTLGSEGRSTATTVLSLAALRRLRGAESLPPKARKLLSFTDNRQDASLQAGHFNDFVEIALLRSAVWGAAVTAGPEGLRHDELTQRVFSALDLPKAKYAQNPEVRFVQLEETQRALRNVLGYYLYRDQRRGWRVTSPNLEQCGLLRIAYVSLHEVAAAPDLWNGTHAVLATATPDERIAVLQVLLDFMRRELAIKVDYLDAIVLERIQQASNQYLVAPWALDEQERFERPRIIVPRGRDIEDDKRGLAHLSPRGGFARHLKLPSTFRGYSGPRLTEDDLSGALLALFNALHQAGVVQRVREPEDEFDAPGYQLVASAMRWVAGDGEQAFHDPIRHPTAPVKGLRTNRFFTDFYRDDMRDMRDLEAREHTAQVPPDLRVQRETAFREARLPLLFCSPTMELGVDIAELNVVNLRNVPPTPANYAQRSGRAGRSGQPALVYTYCSSNSPHDQYFFKRPERMVAGAVSTPRLDLANEDLIRAHVHAIWLRESGLDLGRSLAELLDIATTRPTLALLPELATTLSDPHARERTFVHARVALGQAIAALVTPHGTVDEWLGRILHELPQRFDRACDRWRGLYLAAQAQARRQSEIILDPSRPSSARDTANRLRREAESQLRLLADVAEAGQSDFYSYRYFASEGFLPGYNFPRLPLSAYLQGRRPGRDRDDFVQRPRFLAISEFGPRSFIYHEGSRYLINKVILPADREGDGGITQRAARCEQCGYIHPLEGDAPAPDRCEHCSTHLKHVDDNLFRMQNVATQRRERINSDEEERFRLGYEICTGVRFAERNDGRSALEARLTDANGAPLATLTYGHAATLWRINLGWRRRKDESVRGFVLDTERGYWARTQSEEEEALANADEPHANRVARVIPFVEDTRNCLIFTPAGELDVVAMASLEAALKTAIQVVYQLEDRELGTEPLPTAGDRRTLLFYEASEGGAGVLRRLVEDPAAISAVARQALELAHFDPDTAADRRRAPKSREDCESACYDCLRSYYNQRDHELLDRHAIRALLVRWRDGRVDASPTAAPRDEHLQRLMRLTDSELERRWLRAVEERGLRLPDSAQVTVEAAAARIDFVYTEHLAAIFVDGPHHDLATQRAKDTAQDDALDDLGYTSLRFRHDADWGALFDRFPGVFGKPIVAVAPPLPGAAAATSASSAFDPEDYPEAWQPVFTALHAVGCDVDGGGDVTDAPGRVIGQTVGSAGRSGGYVNIIDSTQTSAETAAATLIGNGAHALVAAPDEPGLAARVLALLGGLQ